MVTVGPNTITPLDSVQIGTQIWTSKNLDVTTYANGDAIPQVTDQVQWQGLTYGAWCYYNNDPANGPLYGKMYNHWAVSDLRGLAPIGWHVAYLEEWRTLAQYLGSDFGTGNAGGQLKETGTTYWDSPNTGATNAYGFNARGGGSRTSGFFELKTRARYWTSGRVGPNTGRIALLYYDSVILDQATAGRQIGESVRLIQNQY